MMALRLAGGPETRPAARRIRAWRAVYMLMWGRVLAAIGRASMAWWGAGACRGGSVKMRLRHWSENRDAAISTCRSSKHEPITSPHQPRTHKRDTMALKTKRHIDAQKVLILPALAAAIWWAGAWGSPTAVCYTAMHGTYFKSYIFPDKSFEAAIPTAVAGAFVHLPLLVFLALPVAFIVQGGEAEAIVLGAALAAFTWGVFFHFVADGERAGGCDAMAAAACAVCVCDVPRASACMPHMTHAGMRHAVGCVPDAPPPARRPQCRSTRT